jgi:hypothetical protein
MIEPSENQVANHPIQQQEKKQELKLSSTPRKLDHKLKTCMQSEAHLAWGTGARSRSASAEGLVGSSGQKVAEQAGLAS